jgi:hypothetical protein
MLRRGLLLIAASPPCLTGAFYLARITGLSISTGGSTGTFWGVVAFASFAVLLLPVGGTMCAVALLRAGRAGEPFVGQALVASALVVGMIRWERAQLARAQSVSSGVAPASLAPPVAAVAPHGGSGLLGLFLTVMVVVGAAVIMRRLRRMIE